MQINVVSVNNQKRYFNYNTKPSFRANETNKEKGLEIKHKIKNNSNNENKKK